MDRIKRIVLWALVSSLAASALADGVRRGSGVLHYTTHAVVSAVPGGPNVTGELRVQYNGQGSSVKQTLNLTVHGLEGITSYTLAALVGDDTNAIVADAITTTGNGVAYVNYSGSGPGGGRGFAKTEALPKELDPLVRVRALSIIDSSTQTLAFVRLDNANAQYLIKRNLDPAAGHRSASASINLASMPGGTVSFRLQAAGLTPGTAYQFSLNSHVVASATSDGKGKLQISVWPADAPALFELRLLQLLDASNNVVLGASFPD